VADASPLVEIGKALFSGGLLYGIGWAIKRFVFQKEAFLSIRKQEIEVETLEDKRNFDYGDSYQKALESLRKANEWGVNQAIELGKAHEALDEKQRLLAHQIDETDALKTALTKLQTKLEEQEEQWHELKVRFDALNRKINNPE